MVKGEKCKVTLKPEYAYGEAGSPPKIPPNATLVFEIELLDFESEKDVTKDGGVIKKVVKEGEGWKQPGFECELKCATQPLMLLSPTKKLEMVYSNFVYDIFVYEML